MPKNYSHSFEDMIDMFEMDSKQFHANQDPLFFVANYSTLSEESLSQNDYMLEGNITDLNKNHSNSTDDGQFVEPMAAEHSNNEESSENEEISLESLSSNNSKDKVSRPHLKRQRRKRGNKNSLEKTVNGYWTKNFLQFGKKVHFTFLEKMKKKYKIRVSEAIEDIRKKKGITLRDYLKLYLAPQLQQIWKKFFQRKELYRGLMLSRTEGEYRAIFIRFIYRFEEAFITKEFDHIADQSG